MTVGMHALHHLCDMDAGGFISYTSITPSYTRAAQKSITGDAKPGWSTNEIGRVSVPLEIKIKEVLGLQPRAQVLGLSRTRRSLEALCGNDFHGGKFVI